MIADKPAPDTACRIRGWGKISYLEYAEETQDTFGDIIAQALNDYYEKHKGLT